MFCFLPVRLVLLSSLFSSLCFGETIHLYTNEEEATGTVIAVLSHHSVFNATEEPATNFRLMKQSNSSFIHVRESDGQLSIVKRIDRERICRGSSNCILSLDMVSFSTDQFKLINVKVEVRDINDHSPHFPNSEMHVDVSEAAPVGTRIPLQMAVDEDIGLNSVQDYLISGNSHFGIDVQTRADGLKYAELILMKELDRETESLYTLELVASDGGSPPLSGSTKVNIRVLDFNDNTPVFEKSSLTVDLLEDASVGYLLLDLNAVDYDEGANGEIIYGFSAQVSEEVRQLFKIDAKSGAISLEGEVDFETKHFYEFDVQAQDMGPNPLTATCKVTVHIIDVNDNTPAITITPLTSTSMGVAYITEAAAKDSFIALISVEDRDSGINGQVHCTLFGHEHFKLHQASENSFMIVTTSLLDREMIAEYNLTIVAEDLGFPSLKMTKHYKIWVSDENDNAPSFTKSLYEVSVLENNVPGAYIATVVAKDPDLGHNGKVSYRLLDGKIMGQSLSTFVVVDVDSGILRTVRSLDYEKLKEIDLEIEASDHGVPKLSTRTQLKIKILDRNDNPPVIISPLIDNGSADVLLSVKSPQNYLVLKVKAVDADEGLNSQLTYTIQQDKHKLFTINRASGEVSLRRIIKPTQDVDLSIVVVVYDSGRPSLSCNATIKFILTDSPPSNVEIVVMQSVEEEQQKLDLSIIFIAVLSGGCTLLLVAILFVACTCKGRTGRSKQESQERRREAEDRLLNTTATPKDSSSTSSDSCQLSVSTESESCSLTSSRDQCRDLHSASNSSVGAPLSDWQQEKIADGTQQEKTADVRRDSVAEPGGRNQEERVRRDSVAEPGGRNQEEREQFSAKDSGKGDSDFNDSASDTSREGVKKGSVLPTQQQTGAPYNEKAVACQSAKSGLIGRNNSSQYSGHYTIRYQKEYAVSYSMPPPYYNTYHPRAQSAPAPQLGRSDAYYHVSHQPAHSDYQRDLTFRSATLSPSRLCRGPQQLHYSHEVPLQARPSEISSNL
ncbi:PREDICTED: protocadherin-8-like [Nanorana parkeri]|uniref:protocadherin-8-like n=1 Tax=Nanorana parkeri TaxID=125878 RepID=UPI000854F30C|nr:PREDICTED: protocadherin-8-like [Nanorana parkeri]